MSKLAEEMDSATAEVFLYISVLFWNTFFSQIQVMKFRQKYLVLLHIII